MTNSTHEVGEPLLKYFTYSHLPEEVQSVNKSFLELVNNIVENLPRNINRTVALRKLIEAREYAVRSLTGE